MAETPDRNQPKKDVPSRQSADMDPDERKFWDLEDDPDSEEKPAEEESASVGSLPELPADSPEEDADPEDEEDTEEEEDQSEPDPSDEEEPTGDEEDDAEPGEPESDSDDTAKGADKSELTDSTKSKANTPRPEAGAAKPAEKIALIVLGVLLLGLVVGVFILLAKSGISTGPKDSAIKFPVTGKAVTLKEVDTYWRRPNREKDRGVRQNTRLIPAAVVTLGSSSGPCALRFFFEDDGGKLIGDSTTHAIAGGNFSGAGAKVEIHATNGFEDTGDHAAYVTGQIEAWHLIVKEGPDRNASGREFKEILRIPITKSRK